MIGRSLATYFVLRFAGWILGMFIGATMLSIGYLIFMAWVDDGLANPEK